MKTLLLSTLLLVACGANNHAQTENSIPSKAENIGKEDSGVYESLRALISRPKDPSTIDSQLMRHRGQTAFLNPSNMMRFIGGANKDKDGAAEMTDRGRAVQESDIFKIGKSGSKTLFLLNNYRGLQIVDFSDGAEKPKMLSRVPATGNYPDDMYFDSGNDKIYVLENNWRNAGTETKARLVVYDVSKTDAPFISQTLDFDGTVNDSRMVGDVLYVVGTTYNRSQGWWNGQEQRATGVVHSFDLSGASVKLKQRQPLSLPAAYGENMNIVESEFAGQTKYYLVAVLSETGWGWWGRKSLVEVVDITDPKGEVRPLLTISAKGFIRERSQTLIKDNTLIVTSNYVPDGAPNNRMRIAIETFELPNNKSEVLSEKEAEFRQLNAERELARYTGNDKEAEFNRLLSDSQLGLRGRFVRTAKGELRKTLADAEVNVGDTQGLSSNLQDVRYADGLLYAFWVPQNNIDPLDVFDISNPAKGVKHLGRLLFEGWIERAVPVSYQGRNFLVGLGWVIPPVNNDQNRRHPQAAIFEVTRTAAGVRSTQLESLTLESSDVWADFNSPDKFVEVKWSGEGTGELLFSVTSWKGGNYQQGGKLLSFDVPASAEGRVGLTEGALLLGDSGWLRRVFTNPEIDRVNTFSDESLGIFDIKSLSGTGIASAVATLELARNVRGYYNLELNGKLYGVQAVSGYGWWGHNQKAESELRLVSAERADSEKPNSRILTLKGYFTAGASAPDGKAIYALTEQTSYRDAKSENGEVYQEAYVTRRLYEVSAASIQGANVTQVAEWESVLQGRWGGGPMPMTSRPGFWRHYPTGLLQLKTGELLIQDSGELRLVSKLNGALNVSKLDSSSCPALSSSELLVQNGSPYWLASEVGEDATRNGLQYSRNYLSMASIQGEKLICEKGINIPGTPLSVKDGVAITRDTWAREIKRNSYTDNDGKVTYYYNVVTDSGLTSVRLKNLNKQATLVDQLEAKGGNHQQMISSDAGLVILEQENTNSDWEQLSQPQQDYWFKYVGTDLRGFFEVNEFSMALRVGSYGQISKIVKTAAGNFEAAVSGGAGIQILSFSDQSLPTVKPVMVIDENGKMSKPVEVVPAAYYWSTESANYTATLGTWEFPQSLGGVLQLK